MSDPQVCALAAVVWLGAFAARPMTPWLIALAVSLAALAFIGPIGDSGSFGMNRRLRDVVLLALAAAALSSALGARAWDGLTPVEEQTWAGTATLLSDPVDTAGGVRLRVNVDGAVVDARAWGGAAGQLRHRLMGERVDVRGDISGVSRLSPWLAARGVRGRMTITSVERWRTGTLLTRVANSVRRTIESGAAVLGRDQRALLTGLVYGDDRQQSAVIADDFKAAGLTHLLAVSGQNVAFVLVLAGPALRRLGYRGRFAVSLLILLAFATLTRFEPSVLRASMMAGVSAVAVVVGRPASSVRVLALAVSALILWSPLIVHAVAFQLSVAASLGILLLSPSITELIRGPRLVAEAFGVTAGAQLGVAPLLIAVFGSVPVASLPANVVAGPAAGPVMMWGLTAGWVAGLVGTDLANVIHAPTRLLIGWIEVVSRQAGTLPLGEIGPRVLVVLVGAVAAAMLFRPGPRRRRLALVAAALVLLVPGASLVFHPPGSVVIDAHSALWRGDGLAVLELDAASRASDVLSVLRRAAVHRLDLVVAERGDRQTFTLLNDVADRYGIERVWAPPGHGLPGAVVPTLPITLDVGRHRLAISLDDTGPRPRLTVDDLPP